MFIYVEKDKETDRYRDKDKYRRTEIVKEHVFKVMKKCFKTVICPRLDGFKKRYRKRDGSRQIKTDTDRHS